MMNPNEGIYLSLLDSAQSAMPLTHKADDEVTAVEWWRPQTPREQEQAYALAKADVIVRLLYGETVVLPYNQLIDSYAWLRIASEFLTTDLASGVEWPLFRFVYFADSSPPVVNSDLVLSVAAAKFAQKTFKLSAWGDLDHSTRQQIAQELEEAKHGQRSILALSLRSDYHEVLLKGLEHTISYFREFERSGREPACYHVSPPKHPLDIWPRLATAVRKDARLGAVLVEELERWFAKHWPDKEENQKQKESRSRLYQAIEAITHDAYYRQSLKAYVDYFYNQKVGFSITRGRGVYVMTDNLQNTPLEEDIRRDQIAGQTGRGTSLGKVAMVHVPLDRPRALHYLDWDIVKEVLRDDQFRQQVKDLRELLFEASSPLTQSQYQAWRRRFEDKIAQHQKWLAEQLGKKLISTKEGLVFRVYQQAQLSLDAATGGLVAYGISFLAPQMFPPLTAALSTWTAGVTHILTSQVIEKTAAGTIIKDLKAAVTFPNETNET